jgi:hypothetical protein
MRKKATGRNNDYLKAFHIYFIETVIVTGQYGTILSEEYLAMMKQRMYL